MRFAKAHSIQHGLDIAHSSHRAGADGVEQLASVSRKNAARGFWKRISGIRAGNLALQVTRGIMQGFDGKRLFEH